MGRWFPDRRAAERNVDEVFYRAPDFLGPVEQVNLVTEAGQRFTEIAGQLQQVAIVGANDVADMLVPGPEGVYLVGTGSVGVAQTFLTIGLIYFAVMMVAAFSYRIPALGWAPKGWTPPDENHRVQKMISAHNVHIDEALRTPQFYLLWVVLCFNVTAGIGVLSVAATWRRLRDDSCVPS